MSTDFAGHRATRWMLWGFLALAVLCTITVVVMKASADEKLAPDDYTSTLAAGDEANFGEWLAYKDGLRVQVIRAERFALTEDMIEAAPGNQGIAVVARVENNTDLSFEPLPFVNLWVGDDQEDAKPVFGAGAVEWSGTLSPGDAQTGRFTFQVPPGSSRELQVGIQPTRWHDDPLYFFGSIAQAQR